MEKVLSLVDSMFTVYGRPLSEKAVADFVASAVPKSCSPHLAETALRAWFSRCTNPPLPKDIRDMVEEMLPIASDGRTAA